MPTDPRLEYPEPEVLGRYWSFPFEHEATAIGYICYHWANIESNLRHMFIRLTDCSGDLMSIVFDATGNSIQARCDVVLKAAHVAIISPYVLEELEEVISYIKNNAAPLRNRIIHDGWTFGKEGGNQIDNRALLKRPVSRARKQLTRLTLVPRSLDDLWLFITQLNDAAHDLSRLETGILLWREKGIPFERRRAPLRTEKLPFLLPVHADDTD